MNTINYLKMVFCSMTSIVIIFGSLMNSFEKHLPVFIRESFRYGKFSYKGKSSFIKPLKVPKSWFQHFYIFSSVITSFTLGLTIKIYVFESLPPPWVKSILDNVGGHLREASVSAPHVLLALSLLTLQCVRRLYDTYFISVFGSNSKMDISHYIVGFIHYGGAVLAILVEAPIYAQTDFKTTLDINNFNLNDLLATTLFLWAFIHQYKANLILGNLRKNAKGEIIRQDYKIPQGDWFEYISSPHLVAEMIMYFSLTVILWGNITWLFIFVWVMSNQVETALISHWWYQETFKDYPPQRKAIIPFIF